MQFLRSARSRPSLLLLVWLLCARLASAQILDEVEVAREGPVNAVVTIRFGVPVHFLRSAGNTRKDLVQVFFTLAGSEGDGGKTFEEFRKPPASDLVPRFSVTYPLITGASTRRLDIQFETPVKAQVRPGRDNRSIQIVLPALTPAPIVTPKAVVKAEPRQAAPVPGELPPSKPAPPPAIVTQAPEEPSAPAPSAAPDTEQKAAGLLTQARTALEGNDNLRAIDLLNELLNLPPTTASREAQELIGVARERQGDAGKARAEYDLFLKLYPAGVDTNRVKQRLAALAGTGPAVSATQELVKPAAAKLKAPTKLVWGSLSQYYYGGKSDTQSQITTFTPATNATTIDTLSLTASDQSSLVTNVDLNGRYTANDWDDRVVVRDTQTTSFIKSQPNRNRLVALYAEAKNLNTQFMGRVGRQSATSGGVLGRFDGAQVGYGIGQRTRLNAVAGRPVDLSADAKPTFYGVSVDADNIADRWSGTFYAIQQRLEGLTDRSGVGAEVRYFDSQRTMFTLVDYDLSFKAINVGMLQGTWQLPSGTALNLLGDYRRSPSLQLSNALLTGTNLTLRELLDTFGTSDVRTQAQQITPISKVMYLGVTQPITPKWLLGADVRVSSLTGTPEIGLLPAAPSTGNVYTYSLQLIGNSLLKQNDVLVLNGSHLTGELNKASSIGLTDRVPFGEKWVFEPSLKYYRQKDNQDVKLTRTTPGFKLSYRLASRVYLEAEATWEKSQTTSATVDDETTRRFYFVGYRWDF
jgi:tetratricopeptide (TPR) repeat protein